MTHNNDIQRYMKNNSVINFGQNIYYSKEADTSLSLLRMERSGLINDNYKDEKRR